jgi:hypothetical protein
LTDPPPRDETLALARATAEVASGFSGSSHPVERELAVRTRFIPLLAPVALASSLLLVAPAQVRAADGLTETGTTVYEVVPSKGVVNVSIQISDYNGKPDSTQNGAIYTWFWNATQVAVEIQAGKVSATSNGGAVTQTVQSTDKYYKYVKLGYPDVYYGQTRIVNASYSIPAVPKAAGGFRALSAYASLCLAGNGYDTGSVSLVIPDGFTVTVESGSALTKTGDSGGKQTFSSGTLSSPYKFWSCIDAQDSSKLSHTALSAGGQTFDIAGWPEDPGWNTSLKDTVTTDVTRLQELTGLQMPGGTINVIEAGDSQLGDYGGVYSPSTATAYIPETIVASTVAHELAHIWFNGGLLRDRWAMEGLASYAEIAAGKGNYTACAKPGTYPGSGSPNLSTWLLLGNDASTQQLAVSEYQYAAACYIFTALADAMGADNFRNVLAAAAADEMAYQGATAHEKLSGSSLPINAKELLDLVDERGMVPAGVTDLAQAQSLLVTYGIFTADQLAARTDARALYHELAAQAGTWKMPFVVRAAMSNWGFTAAQAAMATAADILDLRKSMSDKLGVSFDGTPFQAAFEGAASQSDLETLLASLHKEATAADQVAAAYQLRDGDGGILTTIGLIGTDVSTQLDGAKADLVAGKPDTAASAAQSATDTLRNAATQGAIRLAIVAAAILVLLILVILVLRRRRRQLPRRTGFEQAVYVGPTVAEWEMPGLRPQQPGPVIDVTPRPAADPRAAERPTADAWHDPWAGAARPAVQPRWDSSPASDRPMAEPRRDPRPDVGMGEDKDENRRSWS